MRTRPYHKLTAAALALALLLSLFPAARAADEPAPSIPTKPAVTMASSFSDVGSNYWAKDWIDRCVELNIVQGYANGKFGPDDPVTGAQFATILSRLFFSSQLDANSALASTAWYLPAMTTANNAGLLAGTSNLAGGAGSNWSGSADRNLNRYDMAQMIYNTTSALGKVPDEAALAQARTAVSDFAQIPGKYQTAVSSCIALKAINGMDNGTFSGSGNMTRAQACTVICRVLDAVGDPDGSIPTADVTIAIEPSEVTLEVGKTVSVKAKVTGTTASVTYQSYATDIATIDANGTVTGIAPGSIAIDATVTANGRTYRAFGTVNVKAAGNTVAALDYSDSYKSSKYYTALQAVELTGDYRQDIINIAASQLGYCESNDLNQLDGSHPGSGDCTEYGRYLNSNGSAWCSEFASWCIRQAKVPLGTIQSSRGASVKTFAAPYYSWSQTVFAGGSYTPQPGDLVLYAYNGTSLDADYLSHTAIVTGFSQQGDKVMLYTIDGNSNNSVRRGETSVNASDGKIWSGRIGYFVAPDYGPSSVVPYVPESAQPAVLKFPSEAITLETGMTSAMKAEVVGGSATVSQITYTSSAPTIAAVDSSGNVTAKGAGTAVITAKATLRGGSSITSTLNVTVKGSSIPTDQFATEMIRLINAERAKAGVPALQTMDELTKAAAIRAPELVTTFSSNRPNRSDYTTVLSEVGLSISVTGTIASVAENEAKGATPALVMESLLKNSRQKANILNADFTHIGVAFAPDGKGGYCWVQLFVKTHEPTVLTMPETTLEVEPGKTVSLQAEVTGPYASRTGTVTYESSDQNVATVDRYGVITAKGAGTATITAKVSILGGASSTATCTVTVKGSASTPASSTEAYCAEVVELVNKERAKVGAPALQTMDELTEAAGIRAPELGTLFSHTRPDGTSCFSVFNTVGITMGAYGIAIDYGENAATGQRTPAEAMESWMNSSGHKANILKSNYTHIGVGCAPDGRGGYHWIQMFIQARDTGSSSSSTGTPKVTMISKTLEVDLNATGTVKATVTGTTASVIYSSSDPAIATVTSSSGTVTGKKAGTATITATVKVNGKEYTDTCTVTVKAAPPITFTLPTHKLDLVVDETATIKPTITGTNASAAFNYSCSPYTLVTFNSTYGTVKASNPGTGIITVTARINGTLYTDTCEVTVTAKPTTPTTPTTPTSPTTPSLAFPYETLELEKGQTYTLMPTVSGATSPIISYFSSRQMVAVIDKSGVVTALGTGSTTISAYFAINGREYWDSFTLTVRESSGSESGNNPGGGNNSSNNNSGNGQPSTTYVPANGRVTSFCETWPNGNYRKVEVNGSTVTFSGKYDLDDSLYNYVLISGYGSKLNYAPFFSGQEFSVSITIDVAGLRQHYGYDSSKATSYLTGGFAQNYKPGNNASFAGFGFFQTYSSVRLAVNDNGGLELQLSK